MASPSPRSPPVRPAFLRLSKADVTKKFVDLEWQQRHRFVHGLQESDPPSQWNRLSGEEISRRNRYFNIDPWANNRVCLRVPEGQSDYINASPIVLKHSKSGAAKRFIATQGPKEESTSHFWRMVWHETGPVGVIVMLTQTHESGRDKCFEYFPSSVLKRRNKSKGSFRDHLSPTAEPSDPPNISPASPSPPLSPTDSHDCQENTLHIPPIADCTDDLDLTAEVLSSTYDHPTRSTLSEIRLTNTQAGASTSKTIWHYLFSGWPDFLIPEGEDRAALLELVRYTAEKAGGPENPRVVHCSAGVGRTGTFIALDYLLGELEEGTLHGADSGEAAGGGEKVEGDRVAETVNELRKQRMMMVQGEAQFWFLYEILKEMWERKYGFGAAVDS